MEPMVVIATRAAQFVGAELLKAHQNRHRIDLEIQAKGEHGIDGLVTRLDLYAEELLITTLKKNYPKHSYLGEEFGLQEGSGDDADWCWIIDPLDGTNNFASGIPHFCISLAAQHKGITQHGVIYDPVRDELFSASRGTGAMLNQRRIRVNQPKQLANCLLAVGHPHKRIENGQLHDYTDSHFASLTAITKAGANFRRCGSAALDLAYVAAGRYDGFFERGLKSWDIAAGELIVTEAGGTVVDASGGHQSQTCGEVLACSLKLLKPFMQTVVPAWNSIAPHITTYHDTGASS